MRNKKDTNVEVDLVAFISLLSVCICFLLVTAIWVQVGSMNVKQAVGGAAIESSKEKKPTLWVSLSKDRAVGLRLESVSRKVARKLGNQLVKGKEGKFNVDELTERLKVIKSEVPQLQTALIQPKAKHSYEELILVMDTFRRVELNDLGIIPL